MLLVQIRIGISFYNSIQDISYAPRAICTTLVAQGSAALHHKEREGMHPIYPMQCIPVTFTCAGAVLAA